MNPKQKYTFSFFFLHCYEILEFQVKVRGERGKTFRWIWRVGAGDVDFGISKDGEMVRVDLKIKTKIAWGNKKT